MRLALLLLLGCGGTTTPTQQPDPELGGDESVEAEPVVVADEDPRAVFAAQQAALESQDAAAFVHDFDADAVFVGPVADAVYIGRDAIESALADVVDASGAISVTSEERHFSSLDRVAWSVHDVRVVPGVVEAGAPTEMLHRVSTVYRRSEGWRVAAQAWGVVVPNARYAELSARAGSPRAIEGREDPGCSSAAAEVDAWMNGRGDMWRDNPSAFAAGVDPAELHASTAHLASAGDALAVQQGPGGVRGRALAGDVCLFLSNQVVENRTGGEPRGALPYRLLALFAGDALRLAHVVGIVPDAPPLNETDDPEDSEDGEDGDEDDGDEDDEDGEDDGDDPDDADSDSDSDSE